ncbi:MAG: type 4a pilus biogenesis protein PilO [Armatimonadetes bacterium]|nr:type 4a pilus biogenesis protein PilO [Armatimonadota bacterium]
MKLQLRPTKKALIVLGAVALASVGLAFFTWRVQSEQRVKKQAELKAKQEEMQRVVQEAKSLEDSRAQRDEILYRMGFLRDAEPNDYQPALLLDLASLARTCGVQLATFSPTEQRVVDQKSPVARVVEKKLAPHTFQTINGGMEGSYHDVARFLYRLTGLPKIVSVDSLQVQPVQEEGRAPTDVRISFQMTAYAVKFIDPQTLAAAAKLEEIAKAELAYQLEKKVYADLDTLSATNPSLPKEKAVVGAYTFTTDKAATGKNGFKILAKTTKTGLRDLSINQGQVVTDEVNKTPLK